MSLPILEPRSDGRLYLQRRARGVCVDCAAPRVVPGLLICVRCQRIDASMRRHRQQRREQVARELAHAQAERDARPTRVVKIRGEEFIVVWDGTS